MLISPSLSLMIDVSASGTIQTTIASSEGFFEDSDELHVSNNTTLTFFVQSSVGTLIQGNYSYNGVINGSGTYQNNSDLFLESSSGGNITLTYRALGTLSNETNKTLIIQFFYIFIIRISMFINIDIYNNYFNAC